MRTLTSTLRTAQQTLQGLQPVIVCEVSDRPVESPRWDYTVTLDGAAACHGGACVSNDSAVLRARVTAAGALQKARITAPATDNWAAAWATLAAGPYSTSGQCSIGAATDGGTVVIAYVSSTGLDLLYRVSTDSGATFGAEQTLITEPAGRAIKGVALCGGAGYVYLAFTVDQGGAEPNDTLKVARYQAGVGFGAIAQDAGHNSITACGTALEGTTQRIVLGGAKGLKRRDRDWSGGAWVTAATLITVGATGYAIDRPRLAVNPDSSGRYYYTYEESWTSAVAGSRYWRAVTPVRDSLGEEHLYDGGGGHGLDLLIVGNNWYGVGATGYFVVPKYTGSATQKKDLGADVVAFDIKEKGENKPSRGVIWLRNDDARYASPGTGTYAMLREGSRVALGLGYKTSAGNEYVWLQPYWVEDWYHVDDDGEGFLAVEIADAWAYLDRCRVRYQRTWRSQIFSDLAQKLWWRVCNTAIASITGMSAVASSFTILPGESVGKALRELFWRAGCGLKFKTTAVSGDPGHWNACQASVNTWGAGSSGYSFGPSAHKILSGEYGSRGQKYNLVEVYGSGVWDWGSDAQHAKDAGHTFLLKEKDRSLTIDVDVDERRDRMVAEAQRDLVFGWLECLPHLGAELYDVVDVTDSRAGLSAALRRVVGIRWQYTIRKRGKWLQRLELGAV